MAFEAAPEYRAFWAFRGFKDWSNFDKWCNVVKFVGRIDKRNYSKGMLVHLVAEV